MPNDSTNVILQQFLRNPLRYRAVNSHPFQQDGSVDNYNTQSLSDFFVDQRNYSFQWLFMHNANSDAFDGILKDMPLGLIMRNMVNLSRPVYTDFTETNKDPDFLRISADFYRELFWLEEVYVGYDFFKNTANFTVADGKQMPKEIKHLARRGGFDLFIKQTGEELDDDIGFIHIETGIQVNVPDWWDKMVIARWCGDRIKNFENWFEYSIKYLATIKQLDKFNRLLVKRVRVETSGQNPTEAIQDIEAKISTIESTITVDPTHNADIIAVEYANGQDLESLHYTSFNTLDRLAYELGRVSNTNPKGERLTSGENYKDISSIANRQKATLEQLEVFANAVSDMWGIELSFAVSGIPEKEMVPMENAPAPNPNTEGGDNAGGGSLGGMGVK